MLRDMGPCKAAIDIATQASSRRGKSPVSCTTAAPANCGADVKQPSIEPSAEMMASGSTAGSTAKRHVCMCKAAVHDTNTEPLGMRKTGTFPAMLQSGSAERHVRVREVAIHITNHTVRAGDHGLVVVGASAEQGDLSGEDQAAQAKLSRLLVLDSFLDCSSFKCGDGARKVGKQVLLIQQNNIASSEPVACQCAPVATFQHASVTSGRGGGLGSFSDAAGFEVLCQITSLLQLRRMGWL